jgi:hypothetical protein
MRNMHCTVGHGIDHFEQLNAVHFHDRCILIPIPSLSTFTFHVSFYVYQFTTYNQQIDAKVGRMVQDTRQVRRHILRVIVLFQRNS